MQSRLIKRKSDIQGHGIFANQDIKKGQIFYKIPLDKIIHKPKAKCAFIGHNTWICDNKVLNWINHSCNPNITLDIKKPVLKAIKNIKNGEELTCNYNRTEKGGIKIPCNCKSKNCRGYFLRIE
jgi:hypothetical protein